MRAIIIYLVQLKGLHLSESAPVINWLRKAVQSKLAVGTNASSTNYGWFLNTFWKQIEEKSQPGEKHALYIL